MAFSPLGAQGRLTPSWLSLAFLKPLTCHAHMRFPQPVSTRPPWSSQWCCCVSGSVLMTAALHTCTRLCMQYQYATGARHQVRLGRLTLPVYQQRSGETSLLSVTVRRALASGPAGAICGLQLESLLTATRATRLAPVAVAHGNPEAVLRHTATTVHPHPQECSMSPLPLRALANTGAAVTRKCSQTKRTATAATDVQHQNNKCTKQNCIRQDILRHH